MYQDNSTVHRLSNSALHNNTVLLPQPPYYSPDMRPRDLFPFTEFNETLNKLCFSIIYVMKVKSQNKLKQ